ncbi:MAG TPA: GTP cyclohydrolase I [Castellaniella sp.]|nr:GTP cyclohydrolase I [Castellaniella sp.]
MSIVHRLRPARRANEAIETPLGITERAAMIAAAADKVAELLDIFHIDHRNDHNTRETPLRVARMFVDEIMHGRFSSPPNLTEFENVAAYDQLISIGPIDIRSTCAHHLMPIYGEAYIGLLPSIEGKIIGLSKYDRIVQHFCGRLQIQEELVKQIGQFIMDRTASRGVAIRISAVHMCKTHRGVRSSHRGRMVTNAWFGSLAEDSRLKEEFLRECADLARI